MRMASIASVLLCSTFAATAEHMPATMFESSVAMAVLYADRPSAIVDYVAAMRRNEAEASRGERAQNLFLLQNKQRAREPWTWIAASGDMVRRLREGVFIVRHGDYSANWFSDVECTILEWPRFQCSDGQTVTMSAPDPDTVIFGSVEYRR